MATSPSLLSIEEYLHTSYKPDVHFVDGELEERNVGEYDHARVQTLLAIFFGNNEQTWNVIAVVEQRIRIGSSRVRVCDLAILRADAPREQVTQAPPLICIEIMSPEDRLSRIRLVLEDYFALGVPNIWLIDPLRRCAYTYGPGGLLVADHASLAVPGTPIQVDLAPIFARLDS